MAAKPIGPTKLYIGGEFIGYCKPGEVKITDEPQACPGPMPETCTITYEFTILPYVTDAGRMIAALRPIRFPRNRAGQLGNNCVRALLSRFLKG